MLYAALGPSGHSDRHWRAQNKLNRPLLKDDSIRFSSSSSFDRDEADAWWIAFDLGNVLEREIRASNAILTDIGEATFAAQRVAGVESPAAFSKYVRTNKWRPIDATVRVTDPLKLAETLGGKNLYGQSPLVPLRELVQNAADAIRARRAIQGRGQDFGIIQISIEPHSSEESMCYLHVDDNGVGMSENVLSTTLVDFGKSIWTSSVLNEEFPTLKASSVRNIGKFGIGFFSLFDYATDVKVISKKYSSGDDAWRALEFRAFVTRPLIREATSSELPVDFSTRVTIAVRKDLLQFDNVAEDAFFLWSALRKVAHNGPIRLGTTSLKDALMRMCTLLDINVRFVDHRSGQQFEHLPNVYEKPPIEFIREMGLPREVSHTRFFSLEAMLQSIVDKTGDAFGRAALDLDAIISERGDQRGFTSVGGIVGPSRSRALYAGRRVGIPFLGVVE